MNQPRVQTGLATTCYARHRCARSRVIAGNCLIRIDTDARITGCGEAGSSGPMARARIEIMKPLLVGKDPLLIEAHFHQNVLAG